MAAPEHVDLQPAAGASSSASPKPAGGHDDDPSVSPDRDDPTRLLVKMLAGTALGTPMAAANPVDQHQVAAAAAAAGGASVVSAATAGNCTPGVAPDGDDLTETLTKAFATATLETSAAMANNKAAPGVSESKPIRARPDTPAAAAKPAAVSRAERQARRRMRIRLVRVPTDYLRAGQENLDRKRRRDLVKRCVGRLFAVHEDRASERGISAMMARLNTTPESASGSVDGAVSAAAPSPEHAALADLLDKMALSKKH